MTTPAVCPRCHGSLTAPGLMSSSWRCDAHGFVQPYHLAPAGVRTLTHLAGGTNVPVWLPSPAPYGWLITGMGYAGDHGRACATAIAMSGPSPVGGAADLVLIAEEPGVGLGARYAGITEIDLTDTLAGPSASFVHVGGHPVRLWTVTAGAGRTALVGEAEGVWLWLVLWPEDADVLLYERLSLADLRREIVLSDVEFGAPTPRLTAA